MRKNYFLIMACVVFMPFSQMSLAQVGIGTTSPQSTLHVEGTMRVTNTNSTTTTTKLIGTCSEGIMADIKVGKGLSLTSNELASSVNTAFYGVASVTMTTPVSNHVFDNLNLSLAGTNSDVVIFRFTGSTQNFSVRGIAGGTNGRHVILYNSSAVNMKIDHLLSSTSANSIDTIGTSTSTSGIGTVEMVYDGSTQKWIVLAIRD